MATKVKRAPKTNAQHQRAHRARKRERRVVVDGLVEKIREHIGKDIQITVKSTPWGTLEVEYTMSKDVAAFLTAYAAKRGMSFDDLLTEAMDKSLATFVKAAQVGDYLEYIHRSTEQN